MPRPDEADDIEILGIEAVDEAGQPLHEETPGEDTSTGAGRRAEGASPADGRSVPLGDYEALNDRHLRLMAEFDNYRKRRDREAEAARADGAATVLLEILPGLDNIERAIASLPGETPDGVRQGIDLILKQLRESMRRVGVEEIDALGDQFDPRVHEAVATVDGTAFPGFEDRRVVDQLQRGYTYNGRLLRPALVRVITRPAPENEQSQSEPEAAQWDE